MLVDVAYHMRPTIATFTKRCKHRLETVVNRSGTVSDQCIRIVIGYLLACLFDCIEKKSKIVMSLKESQTYSERMPVTVLVCCTDCENRVVLDRQFVRCIS